MAGLVGRESCLSRPGVRANQLRACAADQRKEGQPSVSRALVAPHVESWSDRRFSGGRTRGSCFRL